MNTYAIITNPSSRSGDGSAAACRLLGATLRKKGLPYRFYDTGSPGDAKRLAEQLTAPVTAAESEEPCERNLVVIGGDGTINEVINGIRDFRGLKFGFIPSGSANDLARGLGLPDKTDGSALRMLVDRIVSGQVLRKIDIGSVHIDHRTDILSRQHPDVIQDNRRFLISSGIGFDAGICEEALNSSTKDFFNRLHLGKLTYGTIAYRTLKSVYSHKVSCDGVTDDGSTVHMDHLLFAAAFNQPYEGGGYRFAPDADNADGKLTFVAIGDMPALQILWHFPGAHRGSRAYYGLPHVEHFHFRTMTVKTGEPMWLHTDGEVSMKTDQVTFSVLPEKLSLIL